MTESFYNFVTRIHLFDVAIQFPELFLLPFKISLRTGSDHLDYNEAKRKCQDKNQRHQRADGQHHHDYAKNGYYGCNKLRKALLQGAANIIDIIDGPA